MKFVRLDEVIPQGVSHDGEIFRRVLLRESELPGSVRLSHVTFRPGQRASAHLHEDICEVFYVLSGCGLFIVDGEESRIESDGCIRIDPGEVHEVVNRSDDDLTMIYFGLKV